MRPTASRPGNAGNTGRWGIAHGPDVGSAETLPIVRHTCVAPEFTGNGASEILGMKMEVMFGFFGPPKIHPFYSQK
jgi:hypothetical protein